MDTNFKQLRENLKYADPPCIPYLGNTSNSIPHPSSSISLLGVYLSDLTFLEEGNPDVLSNGLINFGKCRALANAMQAITHHYCVYPLLHVITNRNFNNIRMFPIDCNQWSLFLTLSRRYFQKIYYLFLPLLL
jgi:hypothetical protein